MMRKRSIAQTSNRQGNFMSDQPNIQSPSCKSNRPTSSLFPSPRLLVGFSSKGLHDPEAVMSPTSILETKSFASIGNPFLGCKGKPPTCEKKQSCHICGVSGPIGLALLDSFRDEDHVWESSNKERRMVLFASQLKIQIPPINQTPSSTGGLSESPLFATEFGIKTMNLHTCSLSPSCLAGENIPPPSMITGVLSAGEMELSEDYTRVIMHGPNPKTTHIFDNCKVESCGDSPVFPSDVFLRFCCTCGKNLCQSKDIFMYRGEKAFCSRECRCKEIEKHESAIP